MSVTQIMAIIIFVAMFLMIVVDKFERHIVTLVSGGLVLTLVFGVCMRNLDAILETLNLKCFFSASFWYGKSEELSVGINWSTIVFILGMMIMVEGMGKAGFFRWLCLALAKSVKYKTVPLLICFMIMAAVLSMFIDSITVIMFLAAVTCELAKTLKFNPIPMIISEIFCSNLGGSATMCGDPPNIIIGTSLGYSFFDFLTNTGFVALISFFAIVLYFWLIFRKELIKSEQDRPIGVSYPDPKSAIKNKSAFIGAAFVFFVAIVLLITHAQTGLTVSAIGVIVAVLMLIVALATSGIEDIKYIFMHVDYKTILFFIGLFISVGGLEQTGVLKLLASFIERISGGNMYIIVAIILWLSAIASAFVDNIPFAATMVPVIQSMASAGISLNTFAWTLSLGTDLGGNATPIGASANVVGTSVCAKSGHPISWGKYCRYCVPATIIVILISMACLYVRYI